MSGAASEQSAPHEGRHHRQAQLARERGDPRLDAVAPNLHVHHEHGRSGGGQLCDDLVGALGERGGIGGPPRQHRDGSGGGSHHVARQLDIDRERALARAAQHAGDLLRRGCRIGEDRLIAGDLLEHGKLGVDRARLVMQQQAAGAFARPRRAGDDDDRRALGIGAGDRVDEVEGACAIGDDGDAQARMIARRGVGGEADRRLVAQGEPGKNAALFHLLEKGEHEVAGNAEQFARPMRLQAMQQGGGERLHR